MSGLTTKLDLIVYGVTGFTGRLVAEYLIERSKTQYGFKWGMAGRSQPKLEQVRQELGAGDIPLFIADASDPASIKAMVQSTRVVLTTVGPYQLYGEPLVEACTRSGTDYVDLTGEANWVRSMIDRYESSAKTNGARILTSCGFDSIPSEIGVWHLQKFAIEKFGKPLPRVRGRVVSFVGGPSGGSVATGQEIMKLASSDPAFLALQEDPFVLTPGFVGPDQPSSEEVKVEADVGPVKPFFGLGPTDAKNVRRSNMLMGFPYGRDFVYDELMLGEMPDTPPPPPANLPKPGQGPARDVLENGSFEILFIGSSENGSTLCTRVKGSMDPGYLSTARMVVETALAISENKTLAGGFWTPVAALQDDLFKRLQEHACMSFEVE